MHKYEVKQYHKLSIFNKHSQVSSF